MIDGNDIGSHHVGGDDVGGVRDGRVGRCSCSSVDVVEVSGEEMAVGWLW